ncbi:MAG: hypothetical protein ACM33T_03625 [Solirubrobacterales bacterium]
MVKEDDALQEFFARGGQVRKCPPGPSENIVYISGPRFSRNNAKKAAPPVAPDKPEDE